MSLSVLHTRAMLGVEAPEVMIETHLSKGLPSLTIVGLPEAAVRESKDRVRSALINSGFTFPKGRITINLSPADLPKEGGRYDLGMALGILVASDQLDAKLLQGIEVYGELLLSGGLRACSGLLSALQKAGKQGRTLLVPSANFQEVSLLGRKVQVAENLNQAVKALKEQRFQAPLSRPERQDSLIEDMSDVRGQAQLKRALSLAAAGGHHVLMIGPPGTGKSMLAHRFPSLLPPLDEEAALEVASVYSASEVGFSPQDFGKVPFRSPHHTASSAALIGGGARPKPGEISLAHRGVLFLDELGEFPTKTLDLMRQPMESLEVHLARVGKRVCYPCNFQLIAAMNPLSQAQIRRLKVPSSWLSDDSFRQLATRLSRPFLDRIDLQLAVPAVSSDELAASQRQTQSTQELRDQAWQAQEMQLKRQGCLNARLGVALLEKHCMLSEESEQFLKRSMNTMGLSARGYHRILRLARTLADMSLSDAILPSHVAEAASYRLMDRYAGA